jgi:LysM repeat protein
VWRSVVALVGIICIFTTVGGAASAADSSVRLTIEASTGSVSSVLVPTEATLQCDGGAHATGFLQRNARSACTLVRSGAVTTVVSQHRKPRLCTEEYGGPQRARITGTIGTRRVDVSIDRNDGCGMGEWDRLRPLLGDPERRGAIPRRPPPVTTTTAAAPITYQVQRGDTLTQIAKRFRTSVGAIVTTNRLSDPDHLADGEELTMPPPSSARLEVDLVDGGAGVGITLFGAEPAEVVTVVVTLPDGETFTGPPHSTSDGGTLVTKYTATLGAGTYTVVATGERGTSAQTSFHLDPPG